MGKGFAIMKRSVFIGLVFCLAFFWLSPGSKAYLKGDIDGDDKITLVEAIHALQVVSGQREALASKTINVPGQFGTIQGAIDAAAEGDTIFIASGTYPENLWIGKNFITLQGAGPETIIQGGTQDAITIQGAKGVGLHGFKIAGGSRGIRGYMGAGLWVSNVTVQNTTGHGIHITDVSTANMGNCEVLGSGQNGIAVHTNSSLVLWGSITSSENGGTGLEGRYTSSIILIDAIVTVNENAIGVRVGDSSSLASVRSQVMAQTNGSWGVLVSGASNLSFLQNETWTTEDGGDRGFELYGTSSCNINASSTLTIRNNNGFGLSLFRSSDLYAAGTLTVEGPETSHAIGIIIGDGSNLNLGGATVLVQGSSGEGIALVRSSSLDMRGTNLSVEIKGNGGRGIGVYHQSSGVFTAGLTIENNGTEDRPMEGLGIYHNSMVRAEGIIIRNNTGQGVLGDDGSSVTMLAGPTITDNTGWDADFRFGARATLYGGNIGTIACSDGAVIRGDYSCP